MNNPEKNPVDVIIRNKSENCPDIIYMNRYNAIDLPDHIQELIINRSNDPNDIPLKKWTRDRERFGDPDKLHDWMKKNRTTYVFTDQDEKNLYGLLWIGKEDLKREDLFPDIDPKRYGFTYAKRIYPDARHQGLSHLQLRCALRDFINSSAFLEDPCTGIWAENKADNKNVLHVDYSFGFKKASNPDRNGRIVTLIDYDSLIHTLYENPAEIWGYDELIEIS